MPRGNRHAASFADQGAGTAIPSVLVRVLVSVAAVVGVVGVAAPHVVSLGRALAAQPCVRAGLIDAAALDAVLGDAAAPCGGVAAGAGAGRLVVEVAGEVSDGAPA